MPHDVFISHSSQDKPVADAVCAALENATIRCWIAPRDVQPGRSFAGEITRAIQRSKVMVLIFSAYSNTSEQVLREVQLAANSHLHIVQFRIADVLPNDDLEYYLSTPHWLDALTLPLERHLDRLIHSVKALLNMAEDESAAAAAPISPKQPVIAPVPLVASEPKRSARKRNPMPWIAGIAAIAVAAIVAVYLARPKPQTRSVSDIQTTLSAPVAPSPTVAVS